MGSKREKKKQRRALQGRARPSRHPRPEYAVGVEEGAPAELEAGAGEGESNQEPGRELGPARSPGDDRARGPEQLDPYRWLLPRHGRMLGDGLIYASSHLMDAIRTDPCISQVAHVAQLPGLVGRSLAMPDIHWGYGFPIGGVAAFDEQDGVVSPGGVGFDINCGVRLLASGLDVGDLRPRLTPLLDALERNIPSGLGRGRKDFCPTTKQMRHLLADGAAWVVRQGLGYASDLERTEGQGRLTEADPDQVSDRALARGLEQIGTLGSGNHFCEVGYVDAIMDSAVARVFGLEEGQVTVSLHTGSRGLGHQVCQEALKAMNAASRKYGISLPDRQLACAPVTSPEGQSYLGAMHAAANFAYANRQALTHFVRLAFEQGLQLAPADHRLRVVYDVAHNLARLESHEVEGVRRRLCVHRKGATRAFAAGHPEIPAAYRAVGHPVLIPGDMGRCSYVLVGTPQAAVETWGSVCHGAGRILSRSEAIRRGRGRDIFEELQRLGIQVRVHGRETLAEEMSDAYKDIGAVIEAVVGAGLARVVARLRPIGVLKG